MSVINRENYEIFFLDFIDGTLRDDLRVELRAFLLKNPDLAAELEEVSGIRLSDEEPESFSSSVLKKAVAPGVDPALPPKAFHPAKHVKPVPIRKLKGEALVFDAKETLYRQHMQSSWNLLPGFSCRSWEKPNSAIFKGAVASEVLPRLVAPTVVFEDKERLKKSIGGARIITLNRALRYSSVAAAVAVLIWWTNSPDSINAELAHQDQSKEVLKPIEKDSSLNLDQVLPSSPSNREQRRWFRPSEELQIPVAEVPSEEVEPQKNEEIINIPLEVNKAPEEAVAQTPAPSNEALPVINIERNSLENGAVYNASNTKDKNTKAFSSIWDYAQNKAKSSLWGDQNYPDDNFTYALLEKGINKGLKKEKDPAITYDAEKESERKVFRIKIGKFEYVRAR